MSEEKKEVGVKKEYYGSVEIEIPDEEIEGLSTRKINNLLRKKAAWYKTVVRKDI